MSLIRTGKRGKRPHTPPRRPALPNLPGSTPHRSTVWACYLMPKLVAASLERLPPKKPSTKNKLSPLATSDASPDLSPDPCDRPNTIPHQGTAAIGDDLDDPKALLDNKGKPWRDIARNAGIELPKTMHFKPPEGRTVWPQTIQTRYKKDEGIINAACEEERELTGSSKTAYPVPNCDPPWWTNQNHELGTTKHLRIKCGKLRIIYTMEFSNPHFERMGYSAQSAFFLGHTSSPVSTTPRF